MQLLLIIILQVIGRMHIYC